MRTGACVLAGLAILAAAAGLEGETRAAADGAADPAGAAGASPSGGADLKWCLRGIAIYHTGIPGDGDLLDLVGGILMHLHCR